MSRSRNLSDVFNPDSEVVNANELTAGIITASAAAVAYTDSEISTIDLSSAIVTASAAAAAYTDNEIASFEALPSQAGNDGKYLTTNGSSTSWATLDLNSAIQTASAGAVTYLVNSAPSTLDTLNELATALGNDENFSTTITNSLSNKLDISSASSIYLTQADASSTYLTESSASGLYMSNAASTSFYRWTKTYSGSASIISGVDDNSIGLSYNAGYIQLFINGVMLDPSEYTATDGSTITVNSPILSGEVVDIFAFLNSTSVNTYSQAQIDAKYNNYSRWRKTYSASATVITGVDDNSLTLSYNPGYEQLYLNGILLTRIIDYAVTDSSTITLGSAVTTNDVVEVINTQPFNVANTYTTSQSDDIFLSKTSASSTYLTQTNATSTYLTQSNASSTYATQTNFSNTGWTSYTPTITQGVTLSKTVNYAKYKQIGKTLYVNISMTITSGGTAGNRIRTSLPIPVISADVVVLGSGYYFDAGTAHYPGTAIIYDVNTVELYTHASANAIGASPGVTAANNDVMAYNLVYEVA
jgi:hypothetical protein